jgi:hypothetical protein
VQDANIKQSANKWLQIERNSISSLSPEHSVPDLFLYNTIAEQGEISFIIYLIN